MTVAASFEIRFTSVPSLPDGREAADLPSFCRPIPVLLVPDYRGQWSFHCGPRALDRPRLLRCNARDRFGTYASTLGKEAVDAGIGRVLHKEDVLLPSLPRERRAPCCAASSPHRTLPLIGAATSAANVFPRVAAGFSVQRPPSARKLPHAAGVAYAMKLRREPRVRARHVRRRRPEPSKGGLLRSDECRGPCGSCRW